MTNDQKGKAVAGAGPPLDIGHWALGILKLSPPMPSSRVCRIVTAVVALAVCLMNAAAGAHAGETTAAATGPVPTYSLEECVAIALRDSPDAIAAARQLDAARAGVISARAGFLPSVSANGNYLRREARFATDAAQDPNRRPDDYNLSARVTQNVYSSGRVRAQVDISKRSTVTSEMAYKATLETVALATRTAFFQVLFAEGNVGVRREAVSLLERQLTDERGRFNAGQVSQVNVQRVEVNVANERPGLFQAQADIATAYLALAQAMGVPYPPGSTRAPFRVRGSLETMPVPPSLDVALRRAEVQRPELAARRLEVDNANRQITVDKATTRPQVSVFAGYDVFSEPNILATKDTYNGYTVGVNASWQVFDGGATLGRVRAGRARVLAAVEQLRQQRLAVQAEVRLAYESLTQARNVLRAVEGNVGLARESLGLINTNLGIGLASQLEVLQGRLDLTRSQITRLSALFSYRVALARLERAMGDTAPAGLPTVSDGRFKLNNRETTRYKK